jgi:hypothetical protein
MKKSFIFGIILLISIIGIASAATTTIFNTQADGCAYRISANSTYASIITGAGTGTSSTYVVYLQTLATTGTNLFNRNDHGIWSFNTSAIPDNANILSATFRVRSQATKTNGLGNYTVLLKNGSLTSNTAVAKEDYIKIGNTEISGRVDYADIPGSSSNLSIPLNAAGLAYINKTGTTIIFSESGWESDGIFGGVWEANKNSNFYVWPNSSGGVNRPDLTVVYDVPTSSSFNIQLIDTSIGPGSSWQWNATNLLGNNTPTTISTAQNPVVALGRGNWLIQLCVSNSIDTSCANQILGLNLTSPQVYFWNRTG